MAKSNRSTEDYLKAILTIEKTKTYVRSIDVVEEMGFSKPSISIAMKKLKQNGYITIDDNHLIELTPMGREYANRVYERHTTIQWALEQLGVEKDTAGSEAHDIEHVISQSTFEKLRDYLHKSGKFK